MPLTGRLVAVSAGVYEFSDVGTPAASLVSDGVGGYDVSDATTAGIGRVAVSSSGIAVLF